MIYEFIYFKCLFQSRKEFMLMRKGRLKSNQKYMIRVDVLRSYRRPGTTRSDIITYEQSSTFSKVLMLLILTIGVALVCYLAFRVEVKGDNRVKNERGILEGYLSSIEVILKVS